MKGKNKRLIIEISEDVVLGRRERRFEAFCTGCKKLSEMATPKIAGALCSITEREISRLIEGEDIHFAESDRVVVCLDSLRAAITTSDSQFTAPIQTRCISNQKETNTDPRAAHVK